jgi:hypothetical protein
MPSPSTVAEFLDLLARSNLYDADRLARHLEQLQAAGPLPDNPRELAVLLLRRGVLTQFQATQLLKGRWRGFFLGKYKVLELLGSGGTSRVFLCVHPFMQRRVAVKVLPPLKASDPNLLARFYREARAASALDHPNLVRAFDVDEQNHFHFLIMEYVDGTNLHEVVTRHGRLGVARAAHYARQAACGLEHVHQFGLVHRDVKPGNLLLNRQGVVKVLDLGLARFFADDRDELTRRLQNNPLMGSADYLSPEQALNLHAADVRSDVYGLGCTLYFLLAGVPPFGEGGTLAQKLLCHQMKDPEPLRRYCPEVPEALAAVVARMMAKKPEARYPTFAEVTAALAPFADESLPPPPAAEMPRLCPAAQGRRGETAVPAGGPRWQVRRAEAHCIDPSPAELRVAPGAAGATLDLDDSELSGFPDVATADFSVSPTKNGRPTAVRVLAPRSAGRPSGFWGKTLAGVRGLLAGRKVTR